MYISNYFATSIRLTPLLLVFLLFSCASPDGPGTSPTVINTGKTSINSTTTNSGAIASSKHFCYVVKVLNKDTKEPIQGAEVSIKIGTESVGPKITDVKGQVVFTFGPDQADQGIILSVKAKGYEEQTLNIALKLNSPPEEVELSSLTPASTPTIPTPIPTSTSVPEPPTPRPETPTPTPAPTTTVPPPPPPTATSTMPTGNLAIPVVFNFGTKVYLTGFNGVGVNGPNEVSIGGAPGSEDARQPMFSRDGKSLMVKATLNGVIGLHKLTASGFNPEIIIRRGSAEWPVLSPDGQTIMFSESSLDYRLHKRLPSDDIETPDKNIEEVYLNGFPIFATNLLWSEDNQLVFQGCAVWKNLPGECGTWVTDASNLNPRRIIVGNEAQPMAIRGNILAYVVRAAGEDWDIYVMSIDDDDAINITNNDFEDGLPTISPDGNAIAYISNESGEWGLWTVNLDGQNKRHWFDIDPGKGVFDINKWDKDRMSWRR